MNAKIKAVGTAGAQMQKLNGHQKVAKILYLMASFALLGLFYMFIEASSTPDHGGMKRSEVYVEQFVNDYHAQQSEGYRPSPDLPAVPFSLPFDWSADPFKDSNWKLSLHMSRMMNPIIARWYESGDNTVLRELYPVAQDWWRWHQLNEPTHYSWYDMVMGVRALRLAFIAERVQAGDIYFSREENQEFLEIVNEHARALKDPQNAPQNNHGLFAAIGLRRMCSMVPEAAECDSAKAASDDHMRRVLKSQYTDEGIHMEHSPGYHLWVSRILKDLGAADLFSEITEIKAVIDKAQGNDGWLVFPTGEAARVGDTWVTGKPLDQMQSPSCLDGPLCYAIGDFSKSGWVIIRSDPALPLEEQSMLFITGMAHSYTHRHADDLSFELMERGERFLIDAGQFSFGLRTEEARAMRSYFESASGHNTIDLPEGVGRRDTKPYGSALNPVLKQNDEFVVSGTAPKRAGKFDQTRTFRYRPGKYLVISDELKSAEPIDFISRLHFEEGIEVLEAADGSFIATKERLRSRIKLQATNCTTILAKGQRSPLLGWKSAKRREFKATFALEARCANQNTIGWLIEFFDHPPEPRIVAQ